MFSLPLLSLQVGLSDDTSLTPVKLFCPKCRDIYNCPNHRRK